MHVLGRPGIEPAPLIHARFEYPRFWKLAIAFSFQVVGEERELNLLAVVQACLRAEAHVTNALAVTAREPSVSPRAHHNQIRCGRRILAHEIKLAQRPLQIFSVEPSAHQHDGGLDALKIFPDCAGLPHFVVGCVVDIDQPIRLPLLEVFFVGIRKGAHVEVKLVRIGCSVFKSRRDRRRRNRIVSARLKALIEAEAMRQHECAVVIAVITQIIVSNRRLWGYCNQGGMSVDHRGACEEARLRDPPDTNLAGIAGNVLNQPIDRVIGIATLIGILWSFFRWLVRANDAEVARAHVAAAHILIHENEFVPGEQLRRAKIAAILIHAVGPDAVWSTGQHNRIGFALT